MKPNRIVIDNKGISAFYMPEKIKQGHGEIGINYLNDVALAAALRDRVYFKPHSESVIILTNLQINGHYVYTKLGKYYPVPEGYSVRIEDDECEDESEEYLPRGKYAILVPKEKGAGDDYPVINEYHSTEKCKDQGISDEQVRQEAELSGIFEEDFGAKIEGDDGTLPSKTILPFEPKTKDQIETIEEAAEKLFPFIDNPYIEEDITETNRHIRTQRINWIVGAKSQAAKDYWHEQFKKEKL